jgi:hypothetical protein
MSIRCVNKPCKFLIARAIQLGFTSYIGLVAHFGTLSLSLSLSLFGTLSLSLSLSLFGTLSLSLSLFGTLSLSLSLFYSA